MQCIGCDCSRRIKVFGCVSCVGDVFSLEDLGGGELVGGSLFAGHGSRRFIVRSYTRVGGECMILGGFNGGECTGLMEENDAREASDGEGEEEGEGEGHEGEEEG